MRSGFCRFTEFCNSQCLSHFAAPFIVDRTETSIAESCKEVLYKRLLEEFINIFRAIGRGSEDEQVE